MFGHVDLYGGTVRGACRIFEKWDLLEEGGHWRVSPELSSLALVPPGFLCFLSVDVMSPASSSSCHSREPLLPPCLPHSGELYPFKL